MNSQQFDKSEPARAQRMTEQETQAVIALWQQERVEQGGLTNKPALSDVAEGLGISVEDTRRLLEHVRSQRTAEEKLLAREQIEAELEQIRLAEEERELAEVRRQRAEVQRQRAERRRRSTRAEEETWDTTPQWIPEQREVSYPHTTATVKDGFVTVFVILLVITMVMWLLTSIMGGHSGDTSSSMQPCYINDNSPSAGGCYVAEPVSQVPYNGPEYHYGNK